MVNKRTSALSIIALGLYNLYKTNPSNAITTAATMEQWVLEKQLPDLEDKFHQVLIKTTLGSNTRETSRQLIDELSQWQKQNKRTEVDRRLRELRGFGWHISSGTGKWKDTVVALRSSEYRVIRIGEAVWDPNWRKTKGTSAKISARVYKRDRYTCQDCKRPDGTVDDRNGSFITLTVGRILPGSAGGPYTMSNCRAECSTCNSAKRDLYYNPEGRLRKYATIKLSCYYRNIWQ